MTQLASMASKSGDRQCGSSYWQSRWCYGLFPLALYGAHLDVTCSDVVNEQLLSLGPEIQVWFGGMVEEGTHAQREKIVAPAAEEVVLQGCVPGSTQDHRCESANACDSAEAILGITIPVRQGFAAFATWCLEFYLACS
jgi:hypothetical protein